MTVIIDDVQIGDRDGAVERSALITWAGGDVQLAISASDAIADRTPDASGFLAVTLPLAMRLGENVHVRGAVDRTLLARTNQLQTIYCAWAPYMNAITVTADVSP